MESHHYFNPYSGQNFFGFFYVLFERLFLFLSGNLADNTLATDEVQILTLIGIAISTSLIGVFLVFRRMTMLANSISHTILIGIALTYLLHRYANEGVLEAGPPLLSMGILFLAALVTGAATCYLTEWFRTTLKLQEDASIGIVFTTFFAIGILLVTLFTRNAHIGTEILMGSVDALQIEDAKWVLILAAINFLIQLLFFKEYLLISFDATSGKLLGLPLSFLNGLFMAQVSVTLVGAFRAIGIILVLAFITGPTLSARFLSFHMKKIIAWAIVIGSVSSLIGVALTRHFLTAYGLALPTGGVVVVIISLFFVLTASYSIICQTASSMHKRSSPLSQ